MKKHVVLYGEGIWAENAMFEIDKYSKVNNIDVEIDYYISDAPLPFIDKERYAYETAPDVDSKFLIIACHDNKYLQIKKKLIACGKKEFDNFIGYRMFGKKICVINCNCYGFVIKECLEQSSSFRDIYGIYPVPAIHLNSEKEIGDNIIKHTDLFIHQDIRKDNAFSFKLSDNYILPRLKSDCVLVCVPNFVGMLDAFYPNILGEGKKYFNVNNAVMFFEDWLIEKAYNESGNSLKEVLQYIYNYKFDENEIRNNFDITVEKWRGREKNWDIKIVDYILDNYQKYPLFEDIAHPSEILFREICKRLLAFLKIDDVNYEKIYHSGCAMEIFVLPQVKSALGMTWEKKKVRLYTIDYCYHDRQPIDYTQFVQEYIWKVFGKMLV